MQAETYISSNGGYTWAMPQGRPASQQRPPLGEKIASARLQAGLTQRQLAHKLDVSQRVITYWEREAVGLRPEQLAALSEALDVPADYFLGTKKKKPGNGPAGKARVLFERVSQLPRSQQSRILETVEDMLVAREARSR
jgi:transcriptional regulator with XRE-family HTH domain